MQVLLFTWSNCKHCEAARDLLIERGIDFEEYLLDNDPARRRELSEQLGRKDMPFVTIDGRLYGGLEGLRKALGIDPSAAAGGGASV